MKNQVPNPFSFVGEESYTVEPGQYGRIRFRLFEDIMAISVKCKSCGGEFRAQAKDRGKSAPCIRCGVVIVIDGKEVPEFDVFVSHSTRDKQAADAIVAALEAAKARCWVAPRDIAPGANWGASIIDAIANCRIMVLVYSANSNVSQQVVREVERAVAKGLVILPVRLDKTPMSKDIEYFISTRHWLDALTPPLEQHLAFLVQTTRAILDGEPAPPAPAVSSKIRRKSKAALLLALVILMMAAVAVGYRPLRERVVALWAGTPQAPSHGVHDEGHFFSTDASAQADQYMAQISATHNREIWIETILLIPTEQKAEFAAQGKGRFFEKWGLQISKKHSVSAIIIFVCKEPGYLQVMAFDKTREKEFTEEDRRALSAEMLAAFTKKEFDRGLLEGIKLMQSRMDRNTGRHTPPPLPLVKPVIPPPVIARAPEKPAVPVTIPHPVIPAPRASLPAAPISWPLADAIQPGAILAAEGRTLTIVERSGDTFKARFETGLGKYVRDVSGTIKEGKLSWLARDVHGVKGGDGGDNIGTIQGDEVHFVWHQSGHRTPSGTFTLRLVAKAKVLVPATPGATKPPSSGFASLFNGKDLTGWTFDGGYENKWAVEGSDIVAHGDNYKTRSYLLTEHEYSNFILRLEFMLDKNDDSGIAVRAVPGENVPQPPTGHPGFDHPILKLEDSVGRGATGNTFWIFDRILVNPDRPAEMHPSGSWNSLEIEVNGHTMRASVNGKQILNKTLDEHARFKDGTIPGLNRVKGRIGLQKHRGTVRFRNIEINELP
jgi:uncharacterized membrane protein YgcG